jgi:UDP-N-acetylmuramate--alanine ligase
MDNILKQAKKIHFIGIGGIGISAIARMMLLEGKTVSGSDLSASLVTRELEKAGAKIFIGQSLDFIEAGTDLIVYTVAITEFDPKLFAELKKLPIVSLSYPETLNIISKEKYTIAVSGTHGKTTVTAMIAKIMIDAGLDPTVIVGSLIGDTNFIMGKSKYLVVEADEYRKSFHNLMPSILVINNIDLDHLDFYKDLADIQNSFLHLAQKLPADGFLVCNTALPNLRPIIEGVKPARPHSGGCQVVDYGGLEMKEKLLIPGEHNRQNAKTAFAVAKVLGVDLKVAEKSLAGFAGTWRRFEYKGKTKSGVLVYDDYAHNPQKVKAALQGAREMYPDKRIVVVFQPHLFSRTKLLLNDFATAFGDADEVILTPIFPAREVFDPSISSEILADKIRETPLIPLVRGKSESPSLTRGGLGGVSSFPDFTSIVSYLKSTIGPNDVLITMGAGEQYKIGDSLL